MSAVRAMLMLRELVPEYLKQVDAIGVSGHMLGLLPMDREGQVLRPAMIRARHARKSCNRNAAGPVWRRLFLPHFRQCPHAEPHAFQGSLAA